MKFMVSSILIGKLSMVLVVVLTYYKDKRFKLTGAFKFAASERNNDDKMKNAHLSVRTLAQSCGGFGVDID